ncbi:MAG: redoxin domain-containing protein, partial [Desulfobulbaceae bacterium]|nr:redoxin domain-containing protein [Desulfobulbaceae bacterium]
MRLSIKIFAAFMAAAIIIGVGPYSGQAEPLTGKAPAFSLKDVNGKTYDLSTMKDHQMIILYFFSADSRPSQEGLLNLIQLSAKYKNSDLKVICITRSPGEKVKQFIQTAGTVFPVLLDKSNVSDLYQAKLILPTVCIIGPELKVLDFFQGGGKTTEIMLSRLAERKLQQKQIMLAKAISEKVITKHPDNIKAKMVKGYAELNEGDLENAKKTFQELSRKKQG